MSQDRPRILVVDDEAFYVNAMRRTLRYQFTVLEATSLKEAQRIWRESRNSIEFLLVDLHLGASLGLELLEEVRQKEKRVPFILMTGSVRQADGTVAVPGCDADAVLNKPFDNNVLLALIDELRKKFRVYEVLVLLYELRKKLIANSK